jgi:hypothetical protein
VFGPIRRLVAKLLKDGFESNLRLNNAQWHPFKETIRELLDMRSVIMNAVPAAVLMCVATACKPAAAFAADLDGSWTVRVFPERGTCDHLSNYNVRVANGHIVYNSHTSVSLSGTISPQCTVMVSIRHLDDIAYGSGHLGERAGKGVWHGLGKDGGCSGRWEAHRR